MTKMVTLSIAALMSTATLGLATPAAAHQSNYDRNGYSTYYSGYDRDDDDRYDRREYRSDRRDYRRDRRQARREYYRDRRDYRDQRCDKGTGGTVIGAIAGGLAGHEIAGRGDRTLGAIIGGAVGAIAGRAIDKGNDGCR